MQPLPSLFIYCQFKFDKASVTMALSKLSVSIVTNRVSHMRAEGMCMCATVLCFKHCNPKHEHTNPLCHHCSPGSCRTSAGPDQRSSSASSHGGSDSSNSKKVEVIDLTLDSSSDDEGQDSPPPTPLLPPPPKRACPSMSPTSPPVINKGSDAHAVISSPHADCI